MSKIWKALKEAKNRPCCWRTIWNTISLIKNSKLTPSEVCKKFFKKSLAKTWLQLFKQPVRLQQNSGKNVYPYTKGKRTNITKQKLQGELWSNLCRIIHILTKFQNFKSNKCLIKNCCIIPVDFDSILFKIYIPQMLLVGLASLTPLVKENSLHFRCVYRGVGVCMWVCTT